MKITLKLATSLDGRIATRTGESQWITCQESRRQVHMLRADHDAILVGSGTMMADDPKLTVRGVNLPTSKQPDRIVLDSKLQTPTNAAIFLADSGRVILFCGEEAPANKRSDLTAKGAEVISVPSSEKGGLDVAAIVEELRGIGLNSVFIEGGGGVAASFLKFDLVTHLEWFRAPIIIGGDGKESVLPLGISELNTAKQFMLKAVRKTGSDIWETYEKE